jgi:hypothetical protein
MDRGYWGGASSCPGRSGSIDLFALPQGPLDNTAQSDPASRADLGSAHLAFTDTAVCLYPPRGYETGSGELPPNGLPTEPPPELALRHGLVP